MDLELFNFTGFCGIIADLCYIECGFTSHYPGFLVALKSCPGVSAKLTHTSSRLDILTHAKKHFFPSIFSSPSLKSRFIFCFLHFNQFILITSPCKNEITCCKDKSVPMCTFLNVRIMGVLHVIAAVL